MQQSSSTGGKAEVIRFADETYCGQCVCVCVCARAYACVLAIVCESRSLLLLMVVVLAVVVWKRRKRVWKRRKRRKKEEEEEEMGERGFVEGACVCVCVCVCVFVSVSVFLCLCPCLECRGCASGRRRGGRESALPAPKP